MEVYHAILHVVPQMFVLFNMTGEI